jgi:alkylresorcinol/alkylpyrone synthase
MNRASQDTLAAPRPSILAGPPRIGALACSSPSRSYSQREALRLLDLEGDEFAERIFARSGVSSRQLELGEEALASNLQARTALVEERLFAHATKAVDATGVDPAEVGMLVTATLYSLGGTTLAHRLVEHYDMDPGVDKYHLTGAGCASAVPLLRLAGLPLGQPAARKSLVVAADLLSGMLCRAAPGDPKAKIVGSALFGDGCAAAVLEAGPGERGPAVAASVVHHIGGSLDAVKMELGETDSHLALAPDLPEAAAEVLSALVDDLLQPLGLTRVGIDHWIVHPGGRRILERVQEALSLSDAQMRVSYAVLAEHGNMGTPTIFYVLDETIRQCAPAHGELGVMVTIGPGVSIGLMLLAW